MIIHYLIYHTPAFPQSIHFLALVFFWFNRIVFLIQVDSNKILFYSIHLFDLIWFNSKI